MKCLLLIYQGDTPTPADPEAWGKLSQDEQNAVYAAYGEINNNPNITPGVGMAQPETATTVRVDNGATLTTDGPFAELKEAIGGFFVLEADDLDGAIEIAAKVPAAGLSRTVPSRNVGRSHRPMRPSHSPMGLSAWSCHSADPRLPRRHRPRPPCSPT